MRSAIIEALDMRSGHPKINTPDFNLRLLLGFIQGGAYGVLGHFRIDDLPFANRPGGGRLP